MHHQITKPEIDKIPPRPTARPAWDILSGSKYARAYRNFRRVIGTPPSRVLPNFSYLRNGYVSFPAVPAPALLTVGEDSLRDRAPPHGAVCNPVLEGREFLVKAPLRIPTHTLLGDPNG